MVARMIAELGHILLICAFIIAVLQAALPLWGAHKNHEPLMHFGSRAALLQCLALIGAYGALTASFIGFDFSLLLAAEHSHRATPMMYRITGVWSNHEGSMLLWVLILGIYGAMIPVFGKHLPLSLKARAIGIQGLLSAGFLSFSILTSNPFERLIPAAYEGAGLNPVLQDPTAAFHPPFLYLGYVGFSLSFAFACAALLEGKVDAVWARWLRPWVLLSWSFLTVGITLGSFWAYYELGWGGWWMWDPVENVSFMPWLAGAALVHSILVLGTRSSLPSWTVLLAITTFSLSLIGTFVVRSGLLTSVHAFAVDPERGLYLLVLLGLYTGLALALYGWRANALRAHDRFEPLSRSGALVLNNLLLIVTTVTVFIGTFYPVIIKGVFDDDLSIGRPYYTITFVPIMILLILVMGVGPLLKWERDSRLHLKSKVIKLAPVLALSFLFFFVLGKSWLAALGLAVGVYLMIATLMVVWSRRKIWRQQSAAFFGFVFGHLGLAVMTLAITLFTSGQTDDIQRLQLGESLTVGPYEYQLKSLNQGSRENYVFTAAEISVFKDGAFVTPLISEARNYRTRDMADGQGNWTTEVGFDLGPKDTIFATLSEWDGQSAVIKAHYHPFVIWIWLGALLIALGGFVSLADRRLRFQTEISKEAS